MRGLCDCPGIESSQSKKGLGERVCPAASDGEVIYWKRGGSLFIPFFVSPKLFSRIRSYPPINGSAGGITRQGGCISILRPKPAYLVKLKEFPSLASDQPRSRLAPSSYSALSLLLRDLQVESGNESMDGERIFGKARKDFFLLKVGVRSAARTGRDVTSITSGGAILPEQSLKQGGRPSFAQVIGYKTARSTWEALDRAYTSQTNARYYQIKHYLFVIFAKVHIPLRNIWIVSAGSFTTEVSFSESVDFPLIRAIIATSGNSSLFSCNWIWVPGGGDKLRWIDEVLGTHLVTILIITCRVAIFQP
ncbi:hypothetical protein Acr_00g0001550 [Actinidia rufa]|uniref:Uncharacterized protein n=1 Tax=Actinidia rufa TaxID=165716 RepID=A0A7J0D8C6_9ERIC|nr:hypothetical protein Acr_00g0001550 [Actinidia rufa]